MTTFSHTKGCTSYLQNILHPRERAVLARRGAERLVEHFPTCDTLVARGVSGILWATAVADLLGLQVAVVRKEEEVETSHGSRFVEVYDTPRCWVFCDDFIGTGRTLTTVIYHMEIAYREAELLGCLFYENEGIRLIDRPDYHPGDMLVVGCRTAVPNF